VSRLVILPARAEDIAQLAPNLREEDAAEVWASSRHTPEESLRFALETSSAAWTAWEDAEPIAMFGVGPGNALTGVGLPWLLGSSALDRHPLAMVRLGRLALRRMAQTYPVLRNAIDARYTRSLRWALMLGFTLGTPAPMPPYGEMFVSIEARA
jgi:hypothetical protein